MPMGVHDPKPRTSLSPPPTATNIARSYHHVFRTFVL